MKHILRLGVLAAAVSLLSACGGGSAGDPSPGDTCGFACNSTSSFRFEPQKARLPANPETFDIEFPDSPYITQLTIRATRANGSPVPENTLVNLSSSNTAVAMVNTSDLGIYGARFNTACGLTSGGLVQFYVISGTQPGQVRLTASMVEPFAPGTVTVNVQERTLQCQQQLNQAGSRTVTGEFIYTIDPPQSLPPRIEMRPARNVLPINSFGFAPSLGSPYLTEVEVLRRRVNGQIILNDSVALTLTPTEVGAISFPSTAENGDLFRTLVSGGNVTVAGGRGLFYAHSRNRSGPFFITASAVDPDSGRPLQITREFRVQAAGSPNPAEVRFITDDTPVYIQGAGGATTRQLQVFVSDGSNSPVADAPGVNNVLLEIATPGAAGGEQINAVGATGPVEGTSIRARTVSGVLAAVFRSGTRQGTITLRATADRADNNVDNGIQQPVSNTATLIVSDGRLFSVTLVRPTDAVSNNQLASPNPVNPDALINRQAGTYRMAVTALATDRQGNPVIPGTPLEFGLIDAPITGYPNGGQGEFQIAGLDGDPQEGGTLFTAPTGAFQTAGAGAGPGDTLVVFGQDVPGNRDLESARTVQSVLSQTSLRVTTRFNFNDDTGQTVNFGPVLPYAIGRATIANIESNTVPPTQQGAPTTVPVRVNTNAQGLAQTFVNYPISQLNRRVIIWARGQGDLVQGSPELVTDVANLVFAGFGTRVNLVASPLTIRGNRVADVELCTYDEINTPLPGVVVNFAFQRIDGSGTVDGVANSGRVERATGTNGCTSARVETRGLLADTEVTFRVRTVNAGDGDDARVKIVVGGTNVLQAIPTELFGNGGTVRLRLLGQDGTPIEGVQINGVCSAPQTQAGSGAGAAGVGAGPSPDPRINITVPPGVTNAQGETTATIVSNFDGFGQFALATCTFSVPSGTPSATVTVRGTNLCAQVPRPAACGALPSTP